jgi:hypothetical protein
MVPLQQHKKDDRARVRMHSEVTVMPRITVKLVCIEEYVRIPMEAAIKNPSLTSIRCLRLLAAVSQRYDWVEWGVLFHDEKQGQPRYPNLLPCVACLTFQVD